MLFEILKRAVSLNADSEFVKGKTLEGEYNSFGKMVVFENNGLSGAGIHPSTTEPAEFSVEAPFGSDPKLYSMRHVEALVIENYVIFVHFEHTPLRPRGIAPEKQGLGKISGAVYKLNEASNKLTNYQFTAASIFGLDNAKPICVETDGICIARDNAEYEDFLCTMTAIGYIDEETTAILQHIAASIL